jgi:hypothetical protein
MKTAMQFIILAYIVVRPFTSYWLDKENKVKHSWPMNVFITILFITVFYYAGALSEALTIIYDFILSIFKPIQYEL